LGDKRGNSAAIGLCKDGRKQGRDDVAMNPRQQTRTPDLRQVRTTYAPGCAPLGAWRGPERSTALRISPGSGLKTTVIVTPVDARDASGRELENREAEATPTHTAESPRATVRPKVAPPTPQPYGNCRHELRGRRASSPVDDHRTFPPSTAPRWDSRRGPEPCRRRLDPTVKGYWASEGKLNRHAPARHCAAPRGAENPVSRNRHEKLTWHGHGSDRANSRKRWSGTPALPTSPGSSDAGSHEIERPGGARRVRPSAGPLQKPTGDSPAGPGAQGAAGMAGIAVPKG